jgi:hypothetical protein
MLSNRNEGLLRQEFKRRYLTEFAGYVGGLMEESGGSSANFLFMVAAFAGASISLPVGGLLAIGISARYARVEAGVKAALAEAAKTAVTELQAERADGMPHVERWLDAHLDDLPGYLDRLDRHEEDRRKAKALIRQVNLKGSADGLTPDERSLLKHCGVRSFRPPLEIGFPLAPRCLLGNWHFTQLDRALWRDMSGRAGGQGQMIRRILGIARS